MIVTGGRLNDRMFRYKSTDPCTADRLTEVLNKHKTGSNENPLNFQLLLFGYLPFLKRIKYNTRQTSKYSAISETRTRRSTRLQGRRRRYGRSGHGRTTFLAENGFGRTTFLADYDFFCRVIFPADLDFLIR